MEKGYTSEKNAQILIALLKANGIKRAIVSPGATNFTFVGSLQNDPYFELYSCVDERSAAYMACGMAAESGEPVMLSSTGSTASRNYYPGLTEAYYRKLPVLAITSHQGDDRIGHLIPQNIDRRHLPADLVRLSVSLPIVKDQRDAAYVETEANKAILELFRHGGGPVHINIITAYSRDFSTHALPPVRAIRRLFTWDELPPVPQGKTAVLIGAHRDFSEQQQKALDAFCATYDAIAICDHTSGYYGRYRLLPTLAQMQRSATPPLTEIDLMVHIGEVSAAAFAGFNLKFNVNEIWRVSEDGELRDPYNRLTTIFEMSEEAFFKRYATEGAARHDFIDSCRAAYETIYDKMPELPFSNIWVARELSKALPEGSRFHFSASNTRRCWNMFPLPDGVQSVSNVGACGIDGSNSALIGSALAAPTRLCFLATGDLAFFYDLNALGNRHLPPNIRILLVNNGIGAEFKLSIHPCNTFGDDTQTYMAAGGHFGNRSRSLVRHYAEDLGFRYLSASDKDSFLQALPVFVSKDERSTPVILEVFTDHESENEALNLMTDIAHDASGTLKTAIKQGLSKVLGEKALTAVKKMVK